MYDYLTEASIGVWYMLVGEAPAVKLWATAFWITEPNVAVIKYGFACPEMTTAIEGVPVNAHSIVMLEVEGGAVEVCMLSRELARKVTADSPFADYKIQMLEDLERYPDETLDDFRMRAQTFPYSHHWPTTE